MLKRGEIERMNRLLLCLTAGIVASTLMGPVLADDTLESIRKQLSTAEHLIEDSSAAKRVTDSANADAQELHSQARSLFKQATEALDSGEIEEAKKLLSNAKKIMFKAVQSAGSGNARSDKARQDYELRALSILALLKAQGRVTDEKHAGETEEHLHWQVETLLEDAGTYYQDGDYAGGMEILNKAYDLLKISIERMREGDTLVNSVNFATAEEEYNYYWEKTGSQFDAINMAARGVVGTRKEQTVQKFTSKMQDARSEASKLAAKGEFEDAIKALLPVFKSAPYQLMSLLR